MVIGSAIRDLATSDKRDLFLAAAFEKTIYVWNIATGKRIAEFDTIMDFGGKRLALSNLKDVFIAGAYTRYGVACYRLTNGERLWHRKDLKGVQTIRITPDDKVVFCGFSDKPGQLLDLDNGNTLQKLRSVRDVFYDSYQGWFVYDRHPYQVEVFNALGNKQAVIPNCSLFDVAFSPDFVALSLGEVRFIPRHDLSQTVLYRSPEHSYIQRIAYSPKANVFFGLQYYTHKRVSSLLLRFDLSLEEPRVVTKVVRGDYAFCDNGNYLITSDGQYINTITGVVEKKFEFPQTEYIAYGGDEEE